MSDQTSEDASSMRRPEVSSVSGRQDEPLVSIAVTYRNAQETIEDLVRSVFAQTLTDWELLLVDDGSVDDTHARLMEIDDSRVRAYRDSEWRGTPVRRNQLTDLARGKYIAVMDADDVMHPDRIAHQVSLLESTGADLICGSMYTTDMDLSLTGIMVPRPVPTEHREVIRRGLLFHAATTGRREWFCRHRYDEDYVRAQDYELWCRAFSETRAYVDDEPAIFCREGASVSLDKYRMSSQAVRKVIRRYGTTHGFLFVVAETLRSHAKEAIYLAASVFGSNKWLVSRRHSALSEDGAIAARLALRVALSARVPGWEDVGLR